MQRTCGLLASLLFLSMAPSALGETSVGLGVGTQAPAFELVDQNGKMRSFESLLSRGKLAIVFYRSADW